MPRLRTARLRTENFASLPAKFQCRSQSKNSTVILEILEYGDGFNSEKWKTGNESIKSVSKFSIRFDSGCMKIMHHQVFFETRQTNKWDTGQQQAPRFVDNVCLQISFRCAESIVRQGAKSSKGIAVLNKRLISQKVFVIHQESISVVQKHPC